MKDGHVDAQIAKCLFIGAAGSGKTNTIYLLFGWPPPPERHSTGCIDPFRAISCIKVGSDGEVWEKVESAKLRSLLASDIYSTQSEASGEAQDEGTGETTSKTSDEASSETIGEASSKTTARASSKTTAEASNKATAEASNKATAEASNKATAEASNKATRKVLADSSRVASAANSSETGVAVAREMYKGVSGGGKLRDMKWIYLIDSGGQSQFHQVLSAFLKDTSAGVFVIDLSQKLSDCPLMELYDKGTRCGESCHSPLTNEQIFRSCIQTVQSLQYATEKGKCPSTFVVGTHQDEEEFETRVGKNERLLEILVPTEDAKDSSFHDNIVYSTGNLNKKEVIFAVNARSREKPDIDIAKKLRGKIANIEVPVHPIPHRWYGLELEIESFAAANNRMIVTLEECLERGEKLYFPSDEAVKAALVHLHNLNIFLYYPDVLPNLVFTNPCALLDKVKELVQKVYELKCPSDEPMEGKWSNFSGRGIVTFDILEEFPSYRRDCDYLTFKDLVQLFEHLLIAARISDTRFFMPALLDLLKPEEIVRSTSEYASALVISFPNGYVPCGLCSALAACLCSSRHNPHPWKLDKSSDKLHGNRITFSISRASVVLIDSGSFFELYVDIQTQPSLCSTLYDLICPNVCQTIRECLKKAIHLRNFHNVKYNETILCQCKRIQCKCCHCKEIPCQCPCKCEAAKIQPHPATLDITTPPYYWSCPRFPQIQW